MGELFALYRDKLRSIKERIFLQASFLRKLTEDFPGSLSSVSVTG